MPGTLQRYCGISVEMLVKVFGKLQSLLMPFLGWYCTKENDNHKLWV